MNHLISGILLSVLLLGGESGDHTDCGGISSGAGTCVVAEVGEEDVTLETEETDEGAQNPGSGGGPETNTPGDSEVDQEPDLTGDRCPKVSSDDPCVVIPPEETNPITLSDLDSFRPTPAAGRSEPDGWAVKGLHTNFYSRGGSQVLEGELLGREAEVRFTPVSWVWDYGDGSSATHSTGGRTWQAQRIREFEPTATSHVYDRKGQFTVRLQVVYTVEYRYDGSEWLDVDGTLTVPAEPFDITVATVKTVLVDDDCEANPRGPGC